jgi:hypothetical protein
MTGRTDFVRFGLFELDLAQGVLTKEGRKIKLQEQPFRVLSILLERPGQTVTREQFRQALWTADTFVDFDRGLGDSADNPLYRDTSAAWVPVHRSRRCCRPARPESHTRGAPHTALQNLWPLPVRSRSTFGDGDRSGRTL